MELLEVLKWRYATKRMTGKKLQADKLKRILEFIRLAPSSYGLQPYEVVVVQSDALKQEIHKRACMQPQVLECSELLVFAAWSDITSQQIDTYMDQTIATRNIEPRLVSTFFESMKNDMKHRTADQKLNWAAKQAYIALSFGLLAAAIEGVDSTPMEGFNPIELDKVLDLRGNNSVALLTLGYRDVANDFLASQPKVRRPEEMLFTFR